MTWGNLPFLDRLKKVKEAGFTHYEFWPWGNKDIDAIVALNRELGLTPVQFSASPVKGFGHGITSPDPARRDEFEEEFARRSLWPRSWASRRFAWWPAKRQRATRVKSKPRPSSPPSRPEPRSSSPRESRSSSSRSTFWSIIPATHRPLRARGLGSQSRRLTQCQDALRHLPPADQRG